MQALEFRTFFYGVFVADPRRRRDMVKHWLTAPPSGGGATKWTRLAHIFEHMLKTLLAYTPVRFVMRRSYMCLLDTLRVPYVWLSDHERDFLVRSVFARRTRLFRSCKMYDGGEFVLDGFIHDTSGTIFDPVWGRELARDFALFVLAARQPHMVHELIVAMQSLMVDHLRGRRDVFLRALHDGVQGTTRIDEVPCWGLEAHDLHPEERENNKKNK